MNRIRPFEAGFGLSLTTQHSIASLLAAVLSVVLAASTQAQLVVSFDETPPGTVPVDDLAVEGVTFDFKVGSFDSVDATFNFSPGPAGQTFNDAFVLEGNATGILTINFNQPTPSLKFDALLNSTFLAATPGLTVDLFGVGLTPLGTIPLALVSPGTGLFLEGQFIYLGGPAVTRAVVDFVQSSAGTPPRFYIDNLIYDIIPPTPGARPPEDPPEPFLLVDVPAIRSANTTGLMVPTMNQQILRRISQPALRDLNSRIFRARADRSLDNGSSMQTETGGPSLFKFLNFMGRQNISPEVALGLSDPHEVEVFDTLRVGMPFALVGGMMTIASSANSTTIVQAAPEGSVKSPVDDKEVVSMSEPRKYWEIFTAADFGGFRQDNLTSVFQGYESQTWAGSVGFEYQPNDWIALGLAYSHLTTDAELNRGLGSADIDGNLYSVYATVFSGPTYLDLLYSYGDFENSLRRQTLVGDQAFADPDAHTHTFSMNAGHNVTIGSNSGIVTGPVVGVDYSSGEVDPYHESGSPRANLEYDSFGFDSIITRLGWQISHRQETDWATVLTQFRFAWEKEYRPDNDQISATLATSPFLLVTPGVGSQRIGGYSTSSKQAQPGTDWLALGAGVRFEFQNDFNLHFDYEGRLWQHNSVQHFASVKVSYEF